MAKGRRFTSIVGTLPQLILLCYGYPIVAQAPSEAPTISGACNIAVKSLSETVVDRKQPQLTKLYFAECGSARAFLGEGNALASAHNSALRSVIAVIRVTGQQKVLLVTEMAGSGLKVTDVTFDLLQVSGLLVDRGFGNFSVNLDKFATVGAVSIDSAAFGGDTMHSRGAIPKFLDLTSYVEAKRKVAGTK